MSIKDAEPSAAIKRLAEELKKKDGMKPPEWSKFVKTGVSAERPPQQPDWWYLRGAAILRKIYLNGPVGVQRLRTVYGSKRRRGVRPAHHMKAGGKIIRLMLQQLEKEGLVTKVEKPKKGKVVTAKGQGLVDKVSSWKAQ